ncbi:MAG: hypothetical protein EBY20_08125, partial [Alphaproteobacteria bacterium]|nr:hypothetical protein [Alphaproteobacteria bacterium]NDE19373.1 hypothetical protein [Alphaproteobacteria bacterium]
MSKLSKPLDIPLRGSKKSFVGIGQNILSDEENSVELVVGKPVIYSKSVKKEIEIDAIYSLFPSPVSNSFTSMSSLQSLPLEEEVSAPERFKSEDVFLPLAPLSGSAEKNTTSVSLVSVTTSESTKESPSISLHAISEPIPIPFSSKSIGSMVSESFPDDTSLLITGSDKNSDLGISLQRTDLEINQKSSELDPGLMQEEQGIKALGDGYF